jgi:hypothetical protein
MSNLLQTSLFEEPARVPVISGLTYIPNYITPIQETELLNIIDKQPWLTDLKRRVQHYGWKYDYKSRNITSEQKLGPLPTWLQNYCNKLHQDGLFLKAPDQLIINEYQPGQGISAHMDTLHFENTIASLSLGSSCIMEFTNNENKVPVLLEPCSLVVLSCDARYKWKHAIPARKTDKYNGQIINRSRRVSLTFRNVIIT